VVFFFAIRFPEGNNVGAYLLDGHDDLNGIQAVQAKVVGEVRNTVDLMEQIELVD
jgi:hypothetical protein